VNYLIYLIPFSPKKNVNPMNTAPMTKFTSRTTTTRNGETLEYVRLRVRADIVDALEEIRPKHLNLTEFLNEVLDRVRHDK